MRETIGLIVVALCMAAIVVLMFRSLLPPAGANGRGLFEGYGDAGALGGFGGGLVASVAAATTLHHTSAGAGSGAAVGAGLGIAYALLTTLGFSLGIKCVSGIVGTAGFIALVVFLITGTGCAVIPLWQRLLILALIIISGALGVAGSFLLARPRIPSTLALFGALKISVFLSAPLGVSLVSLPAEATVVAFLASVLLGALSAIAPQFVIGLAGAVIGVASLSVGVIVGDTCSAGPDFSDLPAVVGFAAVYVLMKVLVAQLVRR